MHYVTLETKGPQLSHRLATEEQKKRAFRSLFIPILALVGLKSGKRHRQINTGHLRNKPYRVNLTALSYAGLIRFGVDFPKRVFFSTFLLVIL